MLAKPRPRDAETEALEEAAGLDAAYGHLTPQQIIELSVREHFAGEIAAVSSFGADSAVLLHMIARIDRNLPVLFLDTGKHFDETLSYRDALVSDFGLSNVKMLTPDPAALLRDDPLGVLHQTDTDACCAIRKVEPLARGLEPFRAWFTGRKRFQAATRSAMPVFESVGSRIRINPMARWTTADQAATCGRTRCAKTRWSPMAICRSAASPARSRCSRATMRAAAAGLATPRSNAASTSPASTSR